MSKKWRFKTKNIFYHRGRRGRGERNIFRHRFSLMDTDFNIFYHRERREARRNIVGPRWTLIGTDNRDMHKYNTDGHGLWNKRQRRKYHHPQISQMAQIWNSEEYFDRINKISSIRQHFNREWTRMDANNGNKSQRRQGRRFGQDFNLSLGTTKYAKHTK